MFGWRHNGLPGGLTGLGHDTTRHAKVPAEQRVEPVRYPHTLTMWSNAYAERWVRTARAEVTDRMLIAGPRHLCAVLDEYAGHYNRHRPHRARDLRPPDCDDITTDEIADLATARIRWRRVVGGFINEYERAA